jgi:sulfopyruvate decarboxylase TPP-binding subunit
MLPGSEVAALLAELGITHVVWLPDSGLGPWEADLESSPAFKLLRVCRESEAWGLAAGLYLGGARPMIVMQTTGVFDSGDSLRNFLFDLRLPLFAIIGHRSYLVENTTDTAKHFAEPILQAWGLDYVLLARTDETPRLREHILKCRAAAKPGIALLAEGRM